MWKKELPKSCPPTHAIEKEVELYRVLSSDTPTEADFKSYCDLYPDNPRFKNLCKAYALSFYDTLDNALLALTRSTTLKGTHIGTYQLNKTHGVCEFKEGHGHYSIWLYDNWDFNEFNPTTISPINGN